MKLKTRWIVLSCAALLGLGLLGVACSDSSSGSKKENTVSATVKDEAGHSQTEQNTQQQPSETFGAVFAGPVLNLYFASSSGTVWTFLVQTDQAPIPGTLAVEAQGGAVSGTFTSGAGGVPQALTTSGTGHLVIDTCPKAVGDLITGKFQAIGFSGAGGTRTLDGDFKLVVKAGSGALTCVQPSEGEGEGSGSCNYLACADANAHCCPYVQCMTTCLMNCTMQHVADPAAIFTCTVGCWDGTCHVSAECKTAATALNQCEQQSSCPTDGSEQEQTCAKQHCCAQVKAAY